MSQALDGQFTGTDPVSKTPWVRKSVSWPAQAVPYVGFMSLDQSVTEGRNNLIAAIADPQNAGPKTIIGSSAGALVVDETLRYYDEHPELAPDPNDVTFVVIADGSRQDAFIEGSPLFGQLSGYTYRTPAETKYDVKVVTYEYDGMADFPDRPTNFMAVSNAVAGMLVLHSATYFADLSSVPDENITVGEENADGGVTTRYLIPAEHLPLVQVMPWLAPMEPQLKQMVDAGYSRNDEQTVADTAALTKAAQNPSPTVPQPQETSLTDMVQAPPDPTGEVVDAVADASTRTSQILKDTAQRVTNRATALLSGNAVKPNAGVADQRRPGTSLADSVRDAVDKTVRDINRSISGLTGASQDTGAKTAGVSGDSDAGAQQHKLNRHTSDDSGQRSQVSKKVAD